MSLLHSLLFCLSHRWSYFNYLLHLDACLSNPCGEIHTCVADGSGYKCICKNEYTGNDCSIAPDHCLPNPCVNSGKCVNTLDDFSCTCVGGYSGSTCEVKPGVLNIYTLCTIMHFNKCKLKEKLF